MEKAELIEHLNGRLGRTDRGGDQVDSGPSDLVSDQADLKPGRLVTDQARSGQEDLSTAQAGPDPAGLSTAQVGLSTRMTVAQKKTFESCDTPRRLTEIMDALKVANRGYFKKRHLDPLLAGGVVRMTHPDQSKHPDQAYVLTEVGVALKARRMKEPAGTGNGGRANGA